MSCDLAKRRGLHFAELYVNIDDKLYIAFTEKS